MLLLLRLLALGALLIGFAGPRLSYPGGIPEFGGSGAHDRCFVLAFQFK